MTPLRTLLTSRAEQGHLDPTPESPGRKRRRPQWELCLPGSLVFDWVCWVGRAWMEVRMEGPVPRSCFLQWPTAQLVVSPDTVPVAAPAGDRAETGAFTLIPFMGNEGMQSGPTRISHCERVPRGCHGTSPYSRGSITSPI